MRTEGAPHLEPGEVTAKGYAEAQGITIWAARYRLEKMVRQGKAAKRIAEWYEDLSTWNAAFGGVVRCERRTAMYSLEEAPHGH